MYLSYLKQFVWYRGGVTVMSAASNNVSNFTLTHVVIIYLTTPILILTNIIQYWHTMPMRTIIVQWCTMVVRTCTIL